MSKKSVAIVGAGPAGLMAAEVLSQYDYDIHVFEQMPSAARKFLMAGKTGLNISHAEDLSKFIHRYDQVEWLKPWITRFDAQWIRAWMDGLGIASYVGSSGRIFPLEMKAAPLLRAWLKRLANTGVQFHYRHKCIGIEQKKLRYIDTSSKEIIESEKVFDAIVLACGAVSWPKLGSDGRWQTWLQQQEINPFVASNVGIEFSWSKYMEPIFGQPLKRIQAWTSSQHKVDGDIVITHYGFESGVIYRLNRTLRVSKTLYLDLLPHLSKDELVLKLRQNKKQSLANIWRKAGLDQTKIALLREMVEKDFWQQPEKMAYQIKNLEISIQGFRPIEEAISCAGGVKEGALSPMLTLKSQSGIFCCGEMLDWDAPTGGYLLTACFATGRIAGEGVHLFLCEKS
ncbi:TIGR03862 family flavoprotein [Acinetobacter nectaris]|uniref:TIGR03862 family flavoprotein n=1 Tax=Acinetobacter nectaris TaxID=1219382 RepID=UPI001F238C13|nr:TIGR03862 family flavoprotein [Acinetobacter nectaris]MCF8998429.1 TIGR03862 family flavoprotein [Acinetobacter nectaris]MCF9027547.1 TIGR03862 family flavoprotein [Acinetobacter nectaris]